MCSETEKTVFHFAVEGSKKYILNHLFEIIPDDKIQKLLHHQDAEGKTVFHCIAAITDGDLVEEVLESVNKCNINWSDICTVKCQKKKTIYHYAIQNQNIHILKHIPDDLTVECDEDGLNYFHYFCQHLHDNISFSNFLRKVTPDDDECQRLATSPTTTTNIPPLLFAMKKGCDDKEFLKSNLKLHKIEDLMRVKFGKEMNTLIMHAVYYCKNSDAKNCFFERLRELKKENRELFETLEWPKNEAGQTILNIIFDKVDDISLDKFLEIIPKEKCKEILIESKPLKPSDDVKGFEMICKVSGLCLRVFLVFY